MRGISDPGPGCPPFARSGCPLFARLLLAFARLPSFSEFFLRGRVTSQE